MHHHWFRLWVNWSSLPLLILGIQLKERLQQRIYVLVTEGWCARAGLKHKIIRNFLSEHDNHHARSYRIDQSRSQSQAEPQWLRHLLGHRTAEKEEHKIGEETLSGNRWQVPGPGTKDSESLLFGYWKFFIRFQVCSYHGYRKKTPVIWETLCKRGDLSFLLNWEWCDLNFWNSLKG